MEVIYGSPYRFLYYVELVGVVSLAFDLSNCVSFLLLVKVKATYNYQQTMVSLTNNKKTDIVLCYYDATPA
jgi:hypothetical protein